MQALVCFFGSIKWQTFAASLWGKKSRCSSAKSRPWVAKPCLAVSVMMVIDETGVNPCACFRRREESRKRGRRRRPRRGSSVPTRQPRPASCAAPARAPSPCERVNKCGWVGVRVGACAQTGKRAATSDERKKSADKKKRKWKNAESAKHTKKGTPKHRKSRVENRKDTQSAGELWDCPAHSPKHVQGDQWTMVCRGKAEQRGQNVGNQSGVVSLGSQL